MGHTRRSDMDTLKVVAVVISVVVVAVVMVFGWACLVVAGQSDDQLMP